MRGKSRVLRRVGSIALISAGGCLHSQVWPAAPGALRAGQEVQFQFSSPRTLPIQSGPVHTTMSAIVSLDGDVSDVRGDTAFVKVIEASNGRAFIQVPYEATATVLLDSSVVATWDHRSAPLFLAGVVIAVAAGVVATYLTR